MPLYNGIPLPAYQLRRPFLSLTDLELRSQNDCTDFSPYSEFALELSQIL